MARLFIYIVYLYIWCKQRTIICKECFSLSFFFLVWQALDEVVSIWLVQIKVGEKPSWSNECNKTERIKLQRKENPPAKEYQTLFDLKSLLMSFLFAWIQSFPSEIEWSGLVQSVFTCQMTLHVFYLLFHFIFKLLPFMIVNKVNWVHWCMHNDESGLCLKNIKFNMRSNEKEHENPFRLMDKTNFTTAHKLNW